MCVCILELVEPLPKTALARSATDQTRYSASALSLKEQDAGIDCRRKSRMGKSGDMAGFMYPVHDWKQ